MLIAQHVSMRIFRYWAVRVTIVCGIGSSPVLGYIGYFLY
jgi:hypothetical protein